jgi:1,4-dihydroxy-2-naphthoate octaprenyltransferase
MTEMTEKGGVAIWLEAARPRTLPLATASILMGSALAASPRPYFCRYFPTSPMTMVIRSMVQIAPNAKVRSVPFKVGR